MINLLNTIKTIRSMPISITTPPHHYLISDKQDKFTISDLKLFSLKYLGFEFQLEKNK